MKTKILLFLLLGLFSVPIYAFHRTYRYDVSALVFSNERNGNSVYTKVTWLDCGRDNNIGCPELPVFSHFEKIEEGIIVDSVKVNLLDGKSGVLRNRIKPIQAPVPMNNTSGDKQWAIDESVYGINTFIPRSNLLDYQVGHSRDRWYLSLSIIPFRYNPATNDYTAYAKAEVEIYTHKESKKKLAKSNYDIGIPYYEYVIITSSQLRSAFEPFAQWKRAKGYEVGIVDIKDILTNPHLSAGDELSHIADDAGKLRQYLINSYNAVQTKYVLLGGDPSVVPIRYGYYLRKEIPSDFYYSELNCNWDANNNGLCGEVGEKVDYGAELYVGRLLCDKAEEVQNWTRKVLQYEINPGNGDYSYLGRALITQSDQMQAERQAETIQVQLSGNIDVTILSEYPNYDSEPPTSPTGSEIIDNINSTHYGLLSNFNHGGPLHYGTATDSVAKGGHDANYGVAAMDSYDEDDDLLFSAIQESGNGFDKLNNTIYPTIMYSTSCENMPFDQFKTPTGKYNLGRVYTCISAGGGPAYLGNTRFGWIGPSLQLYKDFLDITLNNPQVNHLGIVEAKSKSLHKRYDYNYLRHAHNLLGCPEMSLYTHVPSNFANVRISKTNDRMTISTGVENIGTRICLSGKVNGIYRQFVYTDQDNVAFDVVPETYTLVISKPNYLPYVLTNDTCQLQNIVITNNQTYNGCSTFYIGSDITPLQPYGQVTIEDGGDVIINVGDNVTIQNDFEVKLGGKLLIQ